MTTGNPLRQSFSAAVKDALSSDTRRSSGSSRRPTPMDAAMGRTVSTATTAVSKGERYSISRNAPQKSSRFPMIWNSASR